MTRAGRMISALALTAIAATQLSAQGDITGRVVSADSGRPPVLGVEVSIPRITRSVLSDSSGRFRLTNLAVGTHTVVFRAIGFKAETSSVFVDRDESVSLDVMLTRTTLLPERVIEGVAERVPAHLVEFTERRKAGPGHFLERADFAKAEGGKRQTGDVISLIPGVMMRRGSNKAWVASGRARSTGCAFCAMSVNALLPSDVAAGARPACFMDVYLNGALVFDSRTPGNGLFDVNSVPPEHIAGVEVYTSTAQIPAKYNRTGAGCGVLLIWTR